MFIFISHVNRCKIFVEIRLKKSEPQEGMLFIKISKRLDQLIVRVNLLKFDYDCGKFEKRRKTDYDNSYSIQTSCISSGS